VIVPEGAKGGFRMKHQINDRAERRRRADELYQILIRGLLDLADNIVDGRVVHPEGVVIHDGPDPYLVVAADKGTAHLSDTANGLSAEYRFWLDDAFASGGSNGYDHKKVGITARGGWVTARRHFAEMGLDPMSEVFTCVGIGDCAGDVFGNGVIETPKMKLLAAFNHMHVFIDPDPDPEVSYAERLRLFREARGWDHYNPALLSKGGGVFSRRAKSIPLSPEIQEMIGVLTEELPVETMIRLLLRLKVDLLWNGGIGTYVKASDESQADAGDPSNDHLRIDAGELRCRIVGEGGNLGFTQRGRIEYALAGGRINTDALDNSGGVDMSDHEVNLKILMAPIVATGRLGAEERNQLLEDMTDEVADQVLTNNDLHGRQMSLDILRSLRDPMLFAGVIDWACRRSNVSRADLGLPENNELVRRSGIGLGLTRPELCVLGAHVKMHVFKALTKPSNDEIPGLEARVVRYFPRPVQERFADDIQQHMLFKSIGMTVLTNEILGAAGATFFPEMQEATGASIAQIAAAYLHARKALGVDDLVARLGAEGASMDALYRAESELIDGVRALVSLWLTPGEGLPSAGQRAQLSEALALFHSVPGSIHENRLRDRAEGLLASGLDDAWTTRLAVVAEAGTAAEIVALRRDGETLVNSFVRYLALGESSRLLPTIRMLESRRAAGGWDSVAVPILRVRYIRLLRKLVEVTRLGVEAQLGVDRIVLRLTRNHLARLRGMMEQILVDESDLAALMVAEERSRASLAADFSGGLHGTGEVTEPATGTVRFLSR